MNKSQSSLRNKMEKGKIKMPDQIIGHLNLKLYKESNLLKIKKHLT